MRIPVLGIVTAIWQRHELTDIVLGHLATVRHTLAGRIDLRLAAAGSEGATSRTLAKKHGFAYIEVENSPLGRKWNAALGLLRDSDIDGICCIGSDDLINEAYFHTVADALARGERLFGLDSFYVMDRLSGRMYHWMGFAPPRDKEPIGLGRFIHRDYLEALDWRLWDDTRLLGLDMNARDRIATVCAAHGLPGDFGFIPVTQHDIMPVDIKSAQQMWSYEQVALSAHAIRLIGDARAFLASYYPPHVLERVFAPCVAPPASKDAHKDILLPTWGTASISVTDTASRTSPRVPYTLRRNITWFPTPEAFKVTDYTLTERTLTDLVAERFADIYQPAGPQLHIASNRYGYTDNAAQGVYGYIIRNMYVWRGIFRVYIAQTCAENIPLVCDLLEHGNVVICTEDMRPHLPEVATDAVIFVRDALEAITLACRLHDNEKLWQATSRRTL